MNEKVQITEEVISKVYDTFEKDMLLPAPFFYNEVFSRCDRTHYQDMYHPYWYHPDHLGSSSYITNLDGEINQHLEYLPFGEALVEEHLSSYNSPFKFNAKEFDAETGWYYYGARYYDPKFSIWLSVDPMVHKYPEWSPYTYVFHNPVLYVDPDGRDGIVYLVLLNSADRGQVNQMVDKANAFLTDIGVSTRVQVYEGKDMFHAGNLDPTDSFGVIGSTQEITALFENYGDNFKGISSSASPSNIKNSDNFELADRSNGGQGTGFLIKTDLLERGKNEWEAESVGDFGAWLITHSMGHNSGSGHNSDGKAIMASGGLLAKTINPNRLIQSESGGFITGRMSGISTFGDVFNCELNLGVPSLLEGRFGTNATDNYQRNAERIGPRQADGSF